MSIKVKTSTMLSPGLRHGALRWRNQGVFSSIGFGSADQYVYPFIPALTGRGILDELVKSENILEIILDGLMLPVMYWLQFPCLDKPQRTHFWNNQKADVGTIAHLDKSLFVSVEGDREAKKRWWGPLPLFHMPIFGGWRKFVVIEPKVDQDIWYVGWIPGDVIGISKIRLNKKVKLLRGPQTVYFFGLNEHGEQIELSLVGGGEVGKEKNFSKVQFL